MSALGMGAVVMLGREPGGRKKRRGGGREREEKSVAWPGLKCLW